MTERIKFKTRIYYCRALKKTGKPIVVINSNGRGRSTNKIEGYGHWKIQYKNAKSNEKRSGATTILEVWD